MKVKNKATIGITFKGKDIDQRTACAMIMSYVQSAIDAHKLEIEGWGLESFIRVT